MAISWSVTSEGTLFTGRAWEYCEIYLGSSRFMFCKDAWNTFAVYNMNSDTYTGGQVVAEMDSAFPDADDELYAVWFRPPVHDGSTYGSVYVMRHSVSYEEVLYEGLFAGSGEYYEVYRGTFTDATALNITWTKYESGLTAPAFTGLSSEPFKNDGRGFFYDSESDILYWALDKLVGLQYLYAWNMATEEWSTVSTFPESVDVVFLTGDRADRIFVGMEASTHAALVRIYTLTLSSLSWSELTSVPATLVGYASGDFAHHRLFVHKNNPSAVSGDYAYFDFLSSTWNADTLATTSGTLRATAHTDRGPHFYVTSNFRNGTFYRFSNITTRYVTRPSVTQGKAQVERSSVIDTPWNVERHSVTHGTTVHDVDAIVHAKAQTERDSVVAGYPRISSARPSVIVSRDEKSLERGSVVRAKHTMDRSSVLRSKHTMDVFSTVNAGPAVYYTENFRAMDIRQFSCRPLTEESVFGTAYPAFFNRVTVNFNQTTDGLFASSLIAQATGSVNYYSRTVSHTLNLGMVYKQQTALALAIEFLQQHCTIPLEISFSTDRLYPLVSTMDHVTLTHPMGISDSGQFSKTRCRVRSLEFDFFNNVTRFTVISDNYTWFPPFITLVQLSDAQLLGGASVEISGTVTRTLTITEDTVSNKPIQGAKVTIGEETKTTDEFGQVVFLLLPGTYTVFVEAAGHESGSFVIIV